MLPTSVGALLVDLEIRIGDAPVGELFDREIDRVLAEASDGELSRLTWDALLAYVAAKPQLFGRSEIVVPTQYAAMTERYDRDQDGIPSHDEAAAFLFRSAEGTGPFRISGTSRYRNVNRTRSRLFKAIDQSGNGILELAEQETASTSLTALDRNGDWRIDWDEGHPATAVDVNAWDRRQTNRRGEVALDLAGFVDWQTVTRAFRWQRNRRPFGILDPTANDSAAADQSADSAPGELLALDADLRLRVDFDGLGGEPAKLAIMNSHPQLKRRFDVTAAPDQLAWADQTLLLTVSVRDGLSSPQPTVTAAVFAMLDSDGDGLLSQAEIPAEAGPGFSFVALDADADGRLTQQEINRVPTTELPVWSVQVRARGAEMPDAVFAWLDTNRDAMLSEREILTARERLASLANEPLRPSDIPDAFAVQIVRGDPAQNTSLYEFSRPAIRQAVPRWAEHMDANGDGDISRREFLGTAEQFGALDRDADQFIDATEIIEAAELIDAGDAQAADVQAVAPDWHAIDSALPVAASSDAFRGPAP